MTKTNEFKIKQMMLSLGIWKGRRRVLQIVALNGEVAIAEFISVVTIKVPTPNPYIFASTIGGAIEIGFK